MKYKPLYIAATGQHVGKTTVALGLVRYLADRGLSVGFMKPVGQSYVVVNEERVDEDAVLVRDTFAWDSPLKDMSPIAVDRGFTEAHIFQRDSAQLLARIQESYARTAAGRDVMVIEGTGHAGVGSCFGLSNADVAKGLGCAAMVVSGGGIGRAIDEIALSASLFRSNGVATLGAVLNKVLPDKYDKVQKAVSAGLANMGMRLLGAAPYREQLTFPTIGQLAAHLGLQVLAGEEHLTARVEHNIVAAMEPQNMIEYLRDNTLVIMPGDRIDNIMVCISAHLLQDRGSPNLAGIVLTGGLVPHYSIMRQLRGSRLPVMMAEEDTFTVSSRIRELVFKIEAGDKEKIEAAQELVRSYVDVDYILENL